jgi:hypothetical protein
MALEMITLILNVNQYFLLKAASEGEMITMDTANASDGAQRIVAIIYLLTYIASAIFFIRWFRRAYYNLGRKAEYLNDTDGWAAGAWFVPFVNLYKPYQMMKEMYVKTIALLQRHNGNETPVQKTATIGWWWTLWIINGILSQIYFRMSLHAEDIDSIIYSTVVDMMGNVSGIILAFITIKMIGDYARMEPLLNDVISENPDVIESLQIREEFEQQTENPQ